MARNPRLCEEAVPGGLEADGMHLRTNDALRFLDSARGAPFFLFVSYLYPHTPYHVPEPWFSRYINRDLGQPAVEPRGLEAAGKPFRQVFHRRNNDAILPFTPEQTRVMRSVYYGMISLVDGEIGRLLRHLDDRGLVRNTLVVFTSDHGDYMGDHGLHTKSPALYDCLVRVPFIVRWPGMADAGRRDPRFVSHVDLLPTVAAVSGAAAPTQAQGVNLLPSLRDGGRGPAIRDAAFSEYGVPGQPYDQRRLEAEGLAGKKYSNPNQAALPWEGNPVSLAGRIRMLRTREWKFVEEQGGTDELYDLERDPGELQNLAGSRAHRATVEKMRSWLRRSHGTA
jgi:arylsulfatase A-like enzyme